ncbi:hypothetical protein KUTeg_010897 [Tegillarca granosa]|uniref:Fibrinogen C-terminal domain-containing protein n=1 Tax=Tegillarca granosa TaxID=220873 RepID=A0ABQ9F2E0_TEGGR|nr:hypothetical protein KUTeg_010897 [Tegillarca granosa]
MGYLKPYQTSYLKLYNEGYRRNRVYKIYPDGETGFDVYCDMKTDGGGWTVSRFYAHLIKKILIEFKHCFEYSIYQEGSCNIIKPYDCKEWYNKGYRRNRVYKIYPDGKTGFDVYCDMKTDGGGWTVIQRRFNGKTDFYRTWKEYKHGFGKRSEEYWLGKLL